jgi:uncharacterized membrane protein
MISGFKKHTHLLHKAGIFLSVLCFIHCISMPILLTVLPYLGEQYFSHTSEMILVIFSIFIAIGIQVKDYKSHKNRLPLILIASSSFVFIIAFWGFGGAYETILSPFGSFIMAFSFILNWNLHRKHCSNHVH